MRKNFMKKIVSLGLCASACLVVGIATLDKSVKNADAATATTISEMHTLKGFKIGETAAIRKNTPGGLRFATSVSETMQTEISGLLGTGEISYGTLLLPADFLGQEELTHNTPSVVDVEVGTEWNNDTAYTVVLGGQGGVNLGEGYYNRPIVARSYALNKATGVVYYTENTAVRSLGYVAVMATDNNDGSDYITEIVEGTITELVFNENVSIYNEDGEGSELVVNKYEKQSADVFALKIGGIVVEDAAITYTSSNTDVITVADGLVTAVGSGVSTITGTVTYNGVEYKASKDISTDYYAPSSDFTILLPAGATSYEEKAAKKLQEIVLEATGVGLAIVTESGEESTAEKYISIGETALAKKECAVSDLTKDTASRVKTVGETVFVRGATDAATLYGVQKLLKDKVGYEYYLDNTYVVNETKEIIIEDTDYTPAIDEVWQIGGSADSVVAEEHSAVAYTANLVPIGTTDEEDAEGSYRYKGAAHNSILFFSDGVDDSSLYSLSSQSYKKWYATNSSNEYLTSKSGIASAFSGAGKIELCYTAHGDSTVRSEMIEKLAAEMFRKMTTIEEFKNYDRVAFSHSDMQTWCECSNCNNEGNPSDNMLHFILDVAANLKTKLANAGDARANTFKICTLFYNETNLYPANIANYQSAVDNYMQHVEVWFAETRADYHVSLDTATTWNTTAKANFDNWTTLASSKGADVLWWGYYANTKSAFIPYDSIDALRANYALAYNAGVDYMFNQMLQYTANWGRLKQYLMSELRWNATPDDATWNGWIANYMKGAFGPGATAMTEYYNAWKTWTAANKSDFNNTSGYGGSGISKLLSEVASTSDMTAATLQSWIASCNKAIAALDVNDDNYTVYYNNIVLERMTPLYLIMHLYGFNYEISESDNPYEAITSYTLKNSDYVLPYAQDFLDAATLWNVYQDGEMSNLDLFKATLTEQLSDITAYDVTTRQIVVAGTSITLNSDNIASGESYTATLINANGEVAATGVTTSAGSATLTFDTAPAIGACNVVLRSSSKVITFTNVLVVTGTISNYAELKALTGTTVDGYYVLMNDITDVTGTITLRAGTFSGVLDGNGYTVDGVNVGASGLFSTLSGATIKNINFTNFTATSSAFATTATDSTFENISLSFASGGPNLATTSTTCTYTNVTVYVASASAVSLPDGIKVVVGADAGKTFYIPEGETEVWIRDENLVKGDYTVDVNGETYNSSIFAAGRIKVAINGLALGDTVKVSCDNGSNAYVYNVMRVAKLVKADKTTLWPIYNGDKTALGYYNTDVVQYADVAHTAGWDSAIETDKVVIKAPGTQDYITVDFVATSVSGSLFQLWPQKGTGTISSAGAFSDSTNDPSGVIASVVDEYGFSVKSLAAGKRYTLRVYDPNATKLDIGIYGTNTVYFGNVTYGKGTPAEPITPPIYGAESGSVSVYEGDETALGFAENSLVFTYDGTQAGKVAFGVDSTNYSYADVQFVISEGSGYFFMHGVKDGSYVTSYVIDPSWLRISDGNNTPSDRTIQIFDANGKAVSTLMSTNTLYTLRVYIDGLDEIRINMDGSTIYLANVTHGNDAAIQKPTEVVKDGSGTELSQYTGTNADIGFADSDYVFEQVTTSAWDHRAHIGNNSTADFLVFDFSITNPSNMTIWFTRDGNVVAGYSNIVTNTAYVAANECAARTIYVFGADGSGVSSIVANTKYTMWVYLGGADSFHGIAIGNANATLYYANVRYVSGTGDNIMRQGDANALLPEYTADETAYGFEEGTFVQTLVGDSDAWAESINANRARITADGTQDYIAVDFALENALSGSNLFYLWAASSNGAVSNVGVSSAFTMSIVDANGFAASSLEASKKYTLYVYDPGATYLAIGAYCNNTIYFGNVTYGTGELAEPYALLNNATTYEGDVTTLGFASGEYVQQMVSEATDNVWDGTRQAGAVDIPAPEGQYVSVMFSLDKDFTSSDGNLFFAWCRLGETWPTNFYVSLTPSANARILGTNGEVVTDTLKANTVYMLELYAEGVDKYQLANINTMALTVSFAPKSVKTYSTSIAASPITGSRDGAVTVHYGTEALGFGRNEVVQRLETETVSNVWSDTQATSGVGRASWLIKVASEAGKVVKIRFALSKDFTSTGMLFYVWAYSDDSGTCPANGSITLSGSTAMTASITDEAGNAVTELKAYQVYELSLYVDTAIKYDIGNFVAEGMITYVSSTVTYTDYTA
ncbi:MAG: DUF4838 domain-containing protein [Clostridia bacterium]|nr:DUF4838 domain-containing protein [Clostridia bacterium]